MNLFRVDFLHGRDLSLILDHSLIDTPAARAIISLSLSPDALTAVSSYSREPRRLTFTCFTDTWLTDNLLSGTYEYDRYISHFQVNVYRDETQIFAGIIDTSQLSYTVADELLTLTCYTRDKLFSLFPEVDYQYILSAGYTPAWILQYHAAQIEDRVPGIYLPVDTTGFLPAENEVPYTDPVTLADFDYTDMRATPAPSNGWTYGLISPWGPRYGWHHETVSGTAWFFFSQIVTVKASHSDGVTFRYKMRYRARRLRLYNHICHNMDEFDQATDWLETESNDTTTQIMNDLEAWLIAMGTSLSALTGSPGLPSTLTLGTSSYGLTAYADHYVRPNWYGSLIPAKLFPGSGYIDASADRTPCLQVLQAMLLLTNATITAAPDGTLLLRAKSATLPPTQYVDPADVISLSLSRLDSETPDTGALSVLAGDTSLLAPLLRDHLTALYASLWRAEITLDRLDKYTPALLAALSINDVSYLVNSVETDYVADEYRIIAWILPPSA